MPTPKPEELGAFMAAMRQQESSNNYGAFGKPTGDSRGVARGAYQIMSGYWDEWARQAGRAGADWQNPANQDAVAEHKFRQYYDRYNGNWKLVAVAWFAGGGTADEAAEIGIEAFRNQRDNLGQNTAKYADEVMTLFESQGGQPPRVDEHQNVHNTTQNTPSTFGEAQAQAQQQEQQEQAPNRNTARNLAQASIEEMSRYMQSNAGNLEAHENLRTAMGQLFSSADNRDIAARRSQEPLSASVPKPPADRTTEEVDSASGFDNVL